MKAKDLKAHMSQHRSCIHKVLAAAGFKDIWDNGAEIRCATPDGDNKTSVVVYCDDDKLSAQAFSLGYSGDIIGLLETVLDVPFKEVISFMHRILGLKQTGYSRSESDVLFGVLNDISLPKNNFVDLQQKKYDNTVLNTFVPLPHVKILEEGILPTTCSLFNICFDPTDNRIIFPHYDWVDTTKIVGIKGRTVLDEQSMKAFGVPKYFNYIEGYSKSKNLYGWHLLEQRKEDLQQLILFEGEKSVLKDYTYHKNCGTSVALGGHVISAQQVDFILTNTPSDCEIIIAFDKDVMTKTNEGIAYLEEQCSLFKMFRNVSYIYDQYNILENNMAPIDRGYKAFKYLLKHRTRII